MVDVDDVAVLARAVLRERTEALIAETCAWCVGLSEKPHFVRRHGRVVASGETLAARAEADLPLGGEEDALLEIGEAVPGTLRDALNALTPDGRVYADRLDDEVLAPFAMDTAVRAAERVRDADPEGWAELVDEVGEDDLADVVRAAEWHLPLRDDAEVLVLAALGDAPLADVETEGLALAVVRAAEAETRAAAPIDAIEVVVADDDVELAGALFLAKAGLRRAGVPTPARPADARHVLAVLLGEGLEPDEVARLVPHLPLTPDAAEEVLLLAEQEEMRRAADRAAAEEAVIDEFGRDDDV